MSTLQPTIILHHLWTKFITSVLIIRGRNTVELVMHLGNENKQYTIWELEFSKVIAYALYCLCVVRYILFTDEECWRWVFLIFLNLFTEKFNNIEIYFGVVKIVWWKNGTCRLHVIVYVIKCRSHTFFLRFVLIKIILKYPNSLSEC